MRRSGIISGWSISKILYQFYWDQIAVPINYLVFFFNFWVFKRQKRSNETLITSHSKRIDTQGEIQKMERGRDNMIEFMKMVPDECIIELSEKVYCNAKK